MRFGRRRRRADDGGHEYDGHDGHNGYDYDDYDDYDHNGYDYSDYDQDGYGYHSDWSNQRNDPYDDHSGRGFFAADDHHAEHGYYPEDQHKRRRRPVARTLGCLIPLALLAGIGFGGYWGYNAVLDSIGKNTCKVRSGNFDYQWSPEQVANGATIVDVGIGLRGLPSRAALVATTTAIQESKLRNLTSGDLDSLGLFQQRPSQGWGTSAQILDPVHSSTAFYKALVKISGWQSMAVTDAAQEVQHSGYPEAYAAHETQGRVLTEVFSGTTQEGIGCRLGDATSGKSASEVVAKLKAQSGWQTVAADAHTVNANPGSQQRAWAIAQWAVAQADSLGVTRVTVGDREWHRATGREGWTWHAAQRSTSGPAAVRIELYG